MYCTVKDQGKVEATNKGVGKRPRTSQDSHPQEVLRREPVREKTKGVSTSTETDSETRLLRVYN